MPYIEVNGANLLYEIHGDGEPMIQLHGGGFGRGNFARLTPHTSKHYQVVDFDMRGFGDSDAPVQDYTIDTWGDDLAVMMKQLGIERAHIHGTSMGGLIAIAFASKYPEFVDTLILTATLAKYDAADQLRRKVRNHLAKAYGKGEELVDFFCFLFYSRPFLDSDAYEDGRALLMKLVSAQSDPEVDVRINKAIVEADLISRLPAITAPTLVIGGRYDIAAAIDPGRSGAGSRALATGIPNAELHIMDAAHMLLVENPEETTEAIVKYHERLAATAAR